MLSTCQGQLWNESYINFTKSFTSGPEMGNEDETINLITKFWLRRNLVEVKLLN